MQPELPLCPPPLVDSRAEERSPPAAEVSPRAAMTGHLVSSEAPSGRWRCEKGPDQDSRSAGIGDEAVPVRVPAECCRIKIGPNRKSLIKLFRNPLTARALLYAVVLLGCAPEGATKILSYHGLPTGGGQSS